MGEHMVHRQWQAVEAVLTKYWYHIDLQAVKAQLACVAAHFLTEYPPAWLLAIAPSGSAKTVILEAVDKLPYFHQIDQFTPNTFISGMIDEEPKNAPFAEAKRVRRAAEEANAYGGTEWGHEQAIRNMQYASLLKRIGSSGIITIPDFSTVLQKRQDIRDDIFAQLRRVYDGTLRREFGTAGRLSEREWNGRITALAAVTPEIDRYHNIFIALGERWMRIRWARVSGLEAGLASVGQTEEVFARLQCVVKELLTPYIGHPPAAPEIPKAMLHRLINLSELVCIARAHVHLSVDGKEIEGDPYPESNTRLPKNLSQIARGWTALMGEPVCDEAAFALAERVAWDSIPPMRNHVLQCVRRHENRYVGSKSPSSIQRATQELVALGLINKLESQEWSEPTLTPLAEELFRSIPRPEARIHAVTGRLLPPQRIKSE